MYKGGDFGFSIVIATSEQWMRVEPNITMVIHSTMIPDAKGVLQYRRFTPIRFMDCIPDELWAASETAN